MKKIIVSIVAFLYFLSSVGAVVQVHYCMDKLVGWELWKNKKSSDECSTCGMNKTTEGNGCCKDEERPIKIEKDQKTSEFVYKYSFLKFPKIVPSFFTKITVTYLSTLNQKNPEFSNSLAREGTERYLLNRSFRI
ncbi:MAG TPA: hypothetical protein VFN30_12115 [Chitinophagaceae bacterium]|nr:hypothetical protein [Chitinophagaceae bacterium]